MNIKVIPNYAFLLFISFGLSACNMFNDDDFDVIVKANTPATISGTTSGTLSGSDTVVTGALTVTDPDPGEASFQTQTDEAQTYGNFTISASGDWTYTLDPQNTEFMALNGGETATETITVTTVGRTDQVIIITITGVNDIAVLGEGDGVNAESTQSNNSDPVTGTLTLTDADASPDTIVSQTDVASAYGTFSITVDGAWTYTLDTANVAVQALAPGSTLSDVIVVSTADGVTGSVTITIDGASPNIAATFAGDIAASVDAGDTAAVTGTVTVTDPDAGEAVLIAQTNTTQNYGSFSIGTDGGWTYILDNTNTEVQELLVGETLTDTITITSADETEGAVTITINGIVAGPSKSAVIRDTIDTDTGELRYDIDPQLSGRLEVTYDRSASGADAFIALLNSTGSTSSQRSIVDMRIKSSSFQFRDQTFTIADGVVPTPGTPQTVVITWTAPDATTPPTVTVTVDDVNVVAGGGSFTSGAAGIGGVERVQFRYGSNGNVSTSADTYTIEEFEVFSDIAGTTSVFADDFSTYTVGNSLDPNAADTDPSAIVEADSPYSSSSSEVVVEGDAVVVEPPPSTTKAAVIRDTIDTDTGELRYDVGPPGQLSGRLEVTYDRTATGTDAFIALLNDTGSTSSGRSIVDMRIKAGEFQFRDQTFAIADGVVPTPGTPQEVVITWTAPDAVTPPTVMVTVDGANVIAGGGSFTSAAAGIGGVERVQFRYGSNGNVSTSADTYTIEEFEVFSDIAGTTSVFADDFESYTVGNSLDPNAEAPATVEPDTPYNSSSSEVIVE